MLYIHYASCGCDGSVGLVAQNRNEVLYQFSLHLHRMILVLVFIGKVMSDDDEAFIT